MQTLIIDIDHQETILKVFNKKNIWVSMVLAVSLFASTGAWAQVNLNAVKESISKSWKTNLPTIPEITEVKTTPINGLYEVVAGGEVMYTDAQGRYVVMGEILDLVGKRNLTQERASAIEKATTVPIKFANLPFKNAIVVKRGNGSRKIAIFEDPNCGYCHKFEKDLLAVKDVTLYIFLYPILSTDSRVVAQNIWCSSNKNTVWEDWMVNLKEPAKATCTTTALDENLAEGRKYGIKGTPTIIFEDGSRIGGAVPPVAIEDKLKEVAAKK